MNTTNIRYDDLSTLEVTCANRVAMVAINRPETLNAITHDMHHELSLVFDRITEDPDVAVIVLTGKGRAFCAGGDLAWIESLVKTPPLHLDSMRTGRRIVTSMLECPKPIICRLNGDAIGLGATIALMSDIIVANSEAKIADPHVKIGLVAGDGGALIWPMLIGHAKAKELLLTGSAITAAEAERLGLINHSVSPDALDSAVQRIVDKLLANSASAMAYTKLAANVHLRQAIPSILDVSLAFEGLTLLQNADLKEGIEAFRERRAPNFRASKTNR